MRSKAGGGGKSMRIKVWRSYVRCGVLRGEVEKRNGVIREQKKHKKKRERERKGNKGRKKGKESKENKKKRKWWGSGME